MTESMCGFCPWVMVMRGRHARELTKEQGVALLLKTYHFWIFQCCDGNRQLQTCIFHARLTLLRRQVTHTHTIQTRPDLRA